MEHKVVSIEYPSVEWSKVMANCNLAQKGWFKKRPISGYQVSDRTDLITEGDFASKNTKVLRYPKRSKGA